MLFKLFRKEKPKVYLGSLLVAPSEGWRSTLDGWGSFESEDLEAGLRESLENIIELPKIKNDDSHRKTDLALELVVVEHQGGEFDTLSTGGFFVPFFWRPKIKVKARLYYIRSRTTFAVASSKKVITWRRYLKAAFSLNGYFRFRPLFNKKDMEILLCLASLDVIQSLRKKL